MDSNRLGPNGLFYIQRSIDRQIVVYEAKRIKNALVAPLVDLYWSNLDQPRRGKVGAKAQEIFFGVKARKIGTGKYQMVVNAFPAKSITVHLRKSGRCVAKTVIDGKEAKLHRIYVEMSSRMGLPTVDAMWLYGTHKDENVKEKINVTPEMRSRFDVSSLVNLAKFL